jgi:2-C-methyl-D-erythritol 4-phosphate cytidylyltransferase
LRSATAIIVAAGRGTRFGAPDKVLLPLGSRPLLAYSIDAFEEANSVESVIIVAGKHTMHEIERLVAASSWQKVVAIVPGGERRQDSVAAGLAAVPDGSEFVTVHDGARPFVTAMLIDACVFAADQTGAAIAAIPIADTLKQAEAGMILRTVPRTGMWAAQTPQVVRTGLLRDAFANAGEFEITDEASLMESQSIPVVIVPGSARNLKITTADDLILAEALVRAVAAKPLP